jgi:AraC family transcriptional regulator
MVQCLGEGVYLGAMVRSLAVAGVSLSETRYAAGTRLRAHRHERAYFCLIRRGAYEEEYGGRHRSCGPLMLAYHPPGEVHTERFGSAEVRSFNIELAPRWLSGAATRAALGGPFDSRDGRLVGTALRLLEEFESPDHCSPLVVEGLTLELLGRAAREARRESSAPAWLRRVRELLDERCSESFALADLAAEAGVHAGHLACAFRRHFGSSIGDYVRRQRVLLACRGLAESDKPLAEIALETGFADQSHLTRVFKRQLGYTPAAYRKLGPSASPRSKN